MKVILQQDVTNVGRKYQTVEVPNGYALNKLVPRGLAIPATAAAEKALASKAAVVAAEQASLTAQYEAVLAALNTEPLVVAMEANEQGQLFQAVSVNEVEKALTARSLVFPISMCKVPRNIKAVGEHIIEITDGERVSPVTVVVVANA